jgi:glyoxylase-like metal-dependent hydrolase (beta-lactamase superfamily II)
LANHQPVVKLDGNYDVFGDGAVLIVFAPGHTPGHQVLFVDLPKTGPVILAGDLYISQKDRDNAVASPQTPDKRQPVEDLLEQTSAQLWLCHDKEQNDTLAHAPAFHE